MLANTNQENDLFSDFLWFLWTAGTSCVFPRCNSSLGNSFSSGGNQSYCKVRVRRSLFESWYSPGASLDNGGSDGGQFPLEMFPQVVMQLVCRHLVVQHEVDGGRDVGEQRLLQGGRVRECGVLGDLQQHDIFTPLVFTHFEFQIDRSSKLDWLCQFAVACLLQNLCQTAERVGEGRF